METLELTPSGTTKNEDSGKADFKTTESGASVFREPADLFKNWTGPASLESDSTEVIENFEDAPSMESEILFGIIRDPRVRLTKPIPVEVRREAAVRSLFGLKLTSLATAQIDPQQLRISDERSHSFSSVFPGRIQNWAPIFKRC